MKIIFAIVLITSLILLASCSIGEPSEPSLDLPQAETPDTPEAIGESGVASGEYKFVVEGTLRWNNHVIYSGIITVGNEPVTVEAVAELSFEASANGEALTADSSEVSMIEAVTANYFPAAGN